MTSEPVQDAERVRKKVVTVTFRTTAEAEQFLRLNNDGVADCTEAIKYLLEHASGDLFPVKGTFRVSEPIWWGEDV